MGSNCGKPVLGDIDLHIIANTSAMDPTKVQQQFDDFVKAYPTGKVSKACYKKLMSEGLLIRKIGKNKERMEKLANHIFRLYDSNHDGYMDFVECMVVYHIMTQGEDEEVFGKIFRLFDVNGDGYISKQEMKHLVMVLYEFVQTSPDDLVTGVFKEMDKNDDKKISKEEFIAACNAKGGFTKLIAEKAVDILKEFYIEDKKEDADGGGVGEKKEYLKNQIGAGVNEKKEELKNQIAGGVDKKKEEMKNNAVEEATEDVLDDGNEPRDEDDMKVAILALGTLTVKKSKAEDQVYNRHADDEVEAVGEADKENFDGKTFFDHLKEHQEHHSWDHLVVEAGDAKGEDGWNKKLLLQKQNTGLYPLLDTPSSTV